MFMYFSTMKWNCVNTKSVENISSLNNIIYPRQQQQIGPLIKVILLEQLLWEAYQESISDNRN